MASMSENTLRVYWCQWLFENPDFPIPILQSSLFYNPSIDLSPVIIHILSSTHGNTSGIHGCFFTRSIRQCRQQIRDVQSLFTYTKWAYPQSKDAITTHRYSTNQELHKEFVLCCVWVSALLALCEGNPSMTGGFPSQRASNAKLWFFFSLINKPVSPADPRHSIVIYLH